MASVKADPMDAKTVDCLEFLTVTQTEIAKVVQMDTDLDFAMACWKELKKEAKTDN